MRTDFRFRQDTLHITKLNFGCNHSHLTNKMEKSNKNFGSSGNPTVGNKCKYYGYFFI